MDRQGRKLEDGLGRAASEVKVHRVCTDPAEDGPAASQHVSDVVMVERAVTVMVEGVGSFTLMCIPTDLQALAVGFAFSEGIIDDLADVIALSRDGSDNDAIGMQVADPAGAGTERNLIVASSCGMCGTRSLEKVLSTTPACGRMLRVRPGLLAEVIERLRSMQRVFEATGGSHAAAIFDRDGQTLAFGEDLGRHNSLDKAIGKCILADRSMAGCGVALSGRVSFEIVAKAARAGIELMAAVSAPSSFAVEAAERWNITLCGFVRPGRANVYTHPERIMDLNGR